MLGRVPWPLVPVPWRTGPGLRFDLPGCISPPAATLTEGGRSRRHRPRRPAPGRNLAAWPAPRQIAASACGSQRPSATTARTAPVLSPVTTASRICLAATMSSCPVAASAITWCDSGPWWRRARSRRLSASLSRSTCRPSLTRTAVLFRRCANTHHRIKRAATAAGFTRRRWARGTHRAGGRSGRVGGWRGGVVRREVPQPLFPGFPCGLLHCVTMAGCSVSSPRRIEPCVRFSRTRLTDAVHRRHSA